MNNAFIIDSSTFALVVCRHSSKQKNVTHEILSSIFISCTTNKTHIVIISFQGDAWLCFLLCSNCARCVCLGSNETVSHFSMHTMCLTCMRMQNMIYAILVHFWTEVQSNSYKEQLWHWWEKHRMHVSNSQVRVSLCCPRRDSKRWYQVIDSFSKPSRSVRSCLNKVKHQM